MVRYLDKYYSALDTPRRIYPLTLISIASNKTHHQKYTKRDPKRSNVFKSSLTTSVMISNKAKNNLVESIRINSGTRSRQMMRS